MVFILYFGSPIQGPFAFDDPGLSDADLVEFVASLCTKNDCFGIKDFPLPSDVKIEKGSLWLYGVKYPFHYHRVTKNPFIQVGSWVRLNRLRCDDCDFNLLSQIDYVPGPELNFLRLVPCRVNVRPSSIALLKGQMMAGAEYSMWGPYPVSPGPIGSPSWTEFLTYVYTAENHPRLVDSDTYCPPEIRIRTNQIKKWINAQRHQYGPAISILSVVFDFLYDAKAHCTRISLRDKFGSKRYPIKELSIDLGLDFVYSFPGSPYSSAISAIAYLLRNLSVVRLASKCYSIKVETDLIESRRRFTLTYGNYGCEFESREPGSISVLLP